MSFDGSWLGERGALTPCGGNGAGRQPQMSQRAVALPPTRLVQRLVVGPGSKRQSGEQLFCWPGKNLFHGMMCDDECQNSAGWLVWGGSNCLHR